MIRYNIKPYHSSGLRGYHVMIQHHTDINEGGIRGDGGWSLCRDITPSNFLGEITRGLTSLLTYGKGARRPLEFIIGLRPYMYVIILLEMTSATDKLRSRYLANHLTYY